MHRTEHSWHRATTQAAAERSTKTTAEQSIRATAEKSIRATAVLRRNRHVLLLSVLSACAWLGVFGGAIRAGAASNGPIRHHTVGGDSSRPHGALQPRTLARQQLDLRPIDQPSVKHPLTVLEIGDSLGQDLGMGLAAELGDNHNVRLIAKSVGDTGLSNVHYFNWPATLEHDLERFHPQAVTVMLGGNDLQSFLSNGIVVLPGTAPWAAAYAKRVSNLMAEATASGAHVLWVGLPIMGPYSGLNNGDVHLENWIYSRDARAHPGVSFASTWRLFSTTQGQYSQYLPGPGGQLETVRDTDGVHIAPDAGTERLASFVIGRMERDWHIHL